MAQFLIDPKCPALYLRTELHSKLAAPEKKNPDEEEEEKEKINT